VNRVHEPPYTDNQARNDLSTLGQADQTYTALWFEQPMCLLESCDDIVRWKQVKDIPGDTAIKRRSRQVELHATVGVLHLHSCTKVSQPLPAEPDHRLAENNAEVGR
jgi:hypothetical protein